MKFIGPLLFILLFANFTFANNPIIRVALSYEMMENLPKDADCLKRVRNVLPNIEIQDLPWKRIMKELEFGQADLTPCIFKSPGRAAIVHFVGPIAYLPIAIVSRPGQKYQLKDIENLSGAILMGTALVKRYTTPQMKIAEVTKIDNILTLLKRGRVDYSLMPKNFVEGRNTEGLEISIVEKIPLYIGISKASKFKDELSRRFMHTLAPIRITD